MAEEHNIGDNIMGDHIIEFAVDFLSKEEHRANGPIEHVLLPVLLCYSKKLQGGKVLDTKLFNQRLNEEQQNYCKRIFSEAEKLYLNTNHISNAEIFPFAFSFARATQLFITLFGDDDS